MDSVFRFSDYRKALKFLLEEMKKADPDFQLSKFGEVIGVQKTFVSKVLNEMAHLSDDQLYLTLKFLNLQSQEEKYFRILYDCNRTGLHARKTLLIKEIRRMQEEHRQFRLHTKAQMQQPKTESHLGEYYLDPYNLIVHAYLGIEKYQRQPDTLTKILPLSSEKLRSILQCLARLELISLAADGSAKVTQNAIHLDVRSIFCQPHQILFRVKSTEQVMSLPPEKRFILSMSFSGNPDVKNQIQEKYLAFMKEVENILDQTRHHTDVYQINFDLFPWAR